MTIWFAVVDAHKTYYNHSKNHLCLMIIKHFTCVASSRREGHWARLLRESAGHLQSLRRRQVDHYDRRLPGVLRGLRQ